MPVLPPPITEQEAKVPKPLNYVLWRDKASGILYRVSIPPERVQNLISDARDALIRDVLGQPFMELTEQRYHEWMQQPRYQHQPSHGVYCQSCNDKGFQWTEPIAMPTGLQCLSVRCGCDVRSDYPKYGDDMLPASFALSKGIRCYSFNPLGL